MWALIVLSLCLRAFHLPFFTAQAIATLAAMTANFFLNNSTTHRDRRLKGRRIWWGLVTFYMACSLGAAINIRIADALQQLGVHWLIAGACGLLIGAGWNYPITSFFTWRRSRREHRAAQRTPVPAEVAAAAPGGMRK